MGDHDPVEHVLAIVLEHVVDDADLVAVGAVHGRSALEREVRDRVAEILAVGHSESLESDRRGEDRVRDPERVDERAGLLADLVAQPVDLARDRLRARRGQPAVLLEEALVGLDVLEREQVAERGSARPSRASSSQRSIAAMNASSSTVSMHALAAAMAWSWTARNTSNGS